MSEERINITAQVAVKESKEFSKVQHKAVAGLTEEEVIKRNTIGELTEPAESGEQKGT